MSFVEMPGPSTVTNWTEDRMAEGSPSIMEGQSMALEESLGEQQKFENLSIVDYVIGEFQKSKDKRLTDESL
jgi:hypothetical protein